MSSPISRRAVLAQTAALAATAGAFSIVPRHVLGGPRNIPPSEKMNIAGIGVGGMGATNLRALESENIVALCDVDAKRLGAAAAKFPKAKCYADFRKLFDELEKKIDAVVISTPDHTHFHPAYWAIERGKHIYLEKPLAHNVWEIRTLTNLAAEKRVATQLGAQRHTL